MRILARSKIHKATVTDANINYIGSISIDADLLEKANIWPGEKVLVVCNTNGARLETYVIKGKAGSGEITLNGASAHLIDIGDEIIIVAFEITDKPIETSFILVDENNKFVRYL